MPFIGRDWRSPGEAWVKTEALGWQRMKLIESQLFPICCPNKIHHQHQQPSTCSSWPPSNHFGQHMVQANVEDNHIATDCDARSARKHLNNLADPINNRSSDSSGVGSISGGGSPSDSQTTASSSTSSPSTSTSVSPTASPEKVNSSPGAQSPMPSHYIHPIAISSPYGHFSYCACQPHHSHVDHHSSRSPVCEADNHYHYYQSSNTSERRSCSMSPMSCCRCQKCACNSVSKNCTGQQQKLHSLSQQSLSTDINMLMNPDQTSESKKKHEQICDKSLTRCCHRHTSQTSLGLRPNRSLQSNLNNSESHLSSSTRDGPVRLYDSSNKNLSACQSTSHDCSHEQQQQQINHNSITHRNDDGEDCTVVAAAGLQVGRSSAPPQLSNSNKVNDSKNTTSNGSITLRSLTMPYHIESSGNTGGRKPTTSPFKDESIQYDNSTGLDSDCAGYDSKSDRGGCCRSTLNPDEQSDNLAQPSRLRSQQDTMAKNNRCDKNGNNNNNNILDKDHNPIFTTCCCRNSSPYPYQHQNFYGINPSESATKNIAKQPPFCRISVRTREVAMYNTISEAFYRLDFYNAIHDIRRFNYICKLLHLLITQNLTTLSGCATRILFTMLEQVAWEVSSNKRNIHVIKNLLTELKQMIQKYYCWGRPIGSSLLWQQHFDTIERISRIVDGIELAPSNSNHDQITFDKLPVEMVREIVLRLNDYRDLVNSAQASPVMRKMINSQYIWRRMCRYHFTDQQVKLILKEQGRLTNSGGKGLPNSRGIKYARTITADGQGSFRNRTRDSSNEIYDTNQLITNRNNYNNNINSSQIDSNGGVSSDIIDESSASQDGTIIRCRDQVAAPTSSSTTDVGANHDETQISQGYTKRTDRSPLASLGQRQDVRNADLTHNIMRDSNDDIHWGSIFHQLRKRFDLKEEYADCLLLCRHCRCLFWKSFGHPCVHDEKQESCGHDSTTRDVSTYVNGQRINPCINGLNDSTNQPSRPSVASLSRDFNNRAQQSEQRVNSAAQVQQTNGSTQRRPSRTNYEFQNDALLRRLHERRIRLMNQRLEESNQENVDPDPSPQRNHHRDRVTLVPEHVTISPQAFLKFFSL